MNKIALIDLETTGLDPQKHEIIEIGCALFDLGNESEPDTFEVKIHPLRIADADSTALRINGYNKEEWADAYMLRNALLLLNEFVGEAYFMSYNATFDWPFIVKAYHDSHLKDPFHYHRLDILTLAWDRLPTGAFLSLKKVCEHFDIPPEPQVHRALNGALAAHKVFRKLK